MRKLRLRKESLSDLTTDELSSVVGGAPSLIVYCPTDPCIPPQPSRHLGCTFSLGPDVCG